MKNRNLTDLQLEISQSPAIAAVLTHLRLVARLHNPKSLEQLLATPPDSALKLGLEFVDFELSDELSTKIYLRFAGCKNAEETRALIVEIAELLDEHPEFNRFLEEFEAVSPGRSDELRHYLLAQAAVRFMQVSLTKRHETCFQGIKSFQEKISEVEGGSYPHLPDWKRALFIQELQELKQKLITEVNASVGLQDSIQKIARDYQHENLAYRFRSPRDFAAPTRTVKHKIDVFNLTRDSRALLAALLEAHPQDYFFDASDPVTRKSKVYLVPDPHAKLPGQFCKVKLKDSLVRFQRKKVSEEHRFAVCHAKPIGDGGYGVIYESTATLKMRYNKNNHIVGLVCKRKSLEKARVVKHFLQPKNVIRENRILHSVVLLHAKERTVDKQFTRAALVMRKMKGKALIEHLLTDGKKRLFSKREQSSFSVDQRIAMTIMAGEAIIKVHELGIIHRDIQGGNIMLELDENNNPLSAVVIDFGVAKSATEMTDDCVGTSEPIDYRAPESKRDIYPQSNEKSDAYSFAVMLKAIIWDNVLSSERFDALDPHHRADIDAVISRGLEEWSDLRDSLPEIVAAFKKIQLDRKASLEAAHANPHT